MLSHLCAPQAGSIHSFDAAVAPCCLWFTGLSGAGKSTIATALDRRLRGLGCNTALLDGDALRLGLNRDLGFSRTDRIENIRRIAEVARLMVDAGLIVIVAVISPFRADRQLARERFGPGEFLELFVDTPIEICERRDPKGLYKQARAGTIADFTGISSPYEPPLAPDLRLAAGQVAGDELASQVVRLLLKRAGAAS
jgi:bifunctional enzyme CysN/CysC